MPCLISLTITGADDSTDPGDMLALSAEFPFLEWGINLSTPLMGMPGYPTITPEWTTSLLPLAEKCALSAHLGGKFAWDTVEGIIPAWLPAIFKRCQVNGYEAGYCKGVTDLSLDYPIEFILQCRSVDDLQSCATQAIAMGRASVLFDPSGGRGLEPFSWPVAPLNTKIGFAGGITPENVEPVIGEIVAANPTLPSFWIDIESGVRTNDRLDLAKVREVCEKVAEINRRMETP